jgi:hypothetical protein
MGSFQRGGTDGIGVEPPLSSATNEASLRWKPRQREEGRCSPSSAVMSLFPRLSCTARHHGRKPWRAPIPGRDEVSRQSHAIQRISEAPQTDEL